MEQGRTDLQKGLDMKAEFIDVSPEVAERLLTYNTNNRKLKQKAVAEYAYKMANGLWNSNSLDPIVITKDGVLENGQHRLKAVIKSGKTIEMYVITGAVSAAGTYDMNVPRTMTDTLVIRGKANKNVTSNDVQAVVRFVFELLSLPRKTPELVEKYCDVYDDKLYSASRIITTGAKNPICRKSGVRTACYIALRKGIEEDKLCDFFRVVNTGFSEKPEDSTAVLLRNYLLTRDKVKVATAATYSFIRELYIITEFALRDYINKKARKRAYVLDWSQLTWLPEILEEDKKFMKGETANE